MTEETFVCSVCGQSHPMHECTLLATLQMVDRICDVALYLTDGEMQDLTWTDFAAGCTAPELVQYLKERRLYVSEPVTAAEEV